MYKFVAIYFHSIGILLWVIISVFSFCLSIQLDHEYNQSITHQIIRRQTSLCAKTQFTCKSRECIDDSMLCDGAKDCKDGSDETITACKDLGCPGYSFRCTYGACIEASRKCDGHKDCADNSDETHIECPTNSLNSGTTKCRLNEWKCKSSGKCILEDFKCDGKKDCDDGSDETIQECEATQCPGFKYRCNYGACVDISARCNGVQECPDGSDESNCNLTPTKATQRPTARPSSTSSSVTKAPTAYPSSNGVCDVSFGSDRKVVVTDDNDERLNIPPGSKAPRYSKIEVKCNSGYALSSGETVQQSVCLPKEKWIPPLRPCLKTCPRLQTVNVDLSCHREGLEINCNSPLTNGTTVLPRCKPLFHIEKEVYYRELRCMENGEWDNELFKCAPDCGVPSDSAEVLIYEGKQTRLGDSPWHIAIYRVSINYTLICGGTLISSSMVVSAAHCFFDEGLGIAVNSTTDYRIVVAKYTRDYRKVDSVFQKEYELRDIVFTDIGFNPILTGQYGHDIVVLVLKKRVEINKFVLPACVDWTASTTEGFQPGEGVPGKLVGWGVDKIANVGSKTLLSAELPFISYHKCVGKLKHITPDKFCAGSDSGATARKGDSGGGLMFRDVNNGNYFLRGIVSTADKDSALSIVTFTDVAKHLDWLEKVRNKVEKELIKFETTLDSKVEKVQTRKNFQRRS